MTQKDKAEKQREYTKRVAFKLYQNRLLLGRPGDNHSDWDLAEKITRNPLKRALFVSHRPLIKLERQVWEPLLAWANNQALLSLLAIISNAGIIIAVLTYIGTEKQRRDAEVLNAWQTITSADGQSGNGGRIQALEFLNASPGANWRRKFPWFCTPLKLCTWPAETLDGINLSVDSLYTPSELPEEPADSNALEGVYLVSIELPAARLQDANLEGANLRFANLEGARLEKANLKSAYLGRANLQGALLNFANLQGAYLEGADLQSAPLAKANLQGALLNGANFEGAYLGGANLQGAHLVDTNLQGALLEEASLQGALLCRTALPVGIDLDPDRDCEKPGVRRTVVPLYPLLFNPHATPSLRPSSAPATEPMRLP